MPPRKPPPPDARPPHAPAPGVPVTAPPASALSAALLKQIARLKGTPPGEPDAAPKTVNTAVGPRALSPTIAALGRVAWARDRKYITGDPEAEVHLGGIALHERVAVGFEGALYGVAHDELQFLAVVRVDDVSDDPVVYRVDHDASSSLDRGQKLSAFLAGIKTMSAAPAKGTGAELVAAIRDLDAPAALALVARGGAAAVRELERSGFTPLHYAAMAGLADVAAALLAAGAYPDAPMRSAMKFGRKYRGDQWRASREPQRDETPLIAALFTDPAPARAPRDTLGVVRALLAAGADVNKFDSLGRTPLQIATQLPHAQDAVVAALLAAGADPNAWSAAIGSPLGNALIAGVTRVRALLAAGANPNTVTGTTVWEIRGATAVHMAARYNLPEELTALLDAGGDPNVRAADGTLPLRYARLATAEVLRARGARAE